MDNISKPNTPENDQKTDEVMANRKREILIRRFKEKQSRNAKSFDDKQKSDLENFISKQTSDRTTF